MHVRQFAALAALAAISASAWSQSAITIPGNNSRWAAGPDYATDVLGDAWDMSNPHDVSRDPDDRGGWASFSFPGDGTVGGQFASIPGAITFLERGYYDVIHTGRDGARYPIDPSVYRKVTFKMFSGNAGRLPAVYWFQSLKGTPFTPPAPNPDNCQDAQALCGVMFVDSQTNGGWKIHTADTTKPPAAGRPFSSFPVLSLRVDPAVDVAGYNVFFDWVRVTRADSDPARANMPITFSGSAASSITITDAGGATYNVMAQSCPTGVSPCNFNYGVLPPGTYTLTVINSAGTSNAVFTINNPPIVQVTDPDESQPSGADFATTVLGNPWDMNEAADVASLGNVSNVSFAGGILNGTNSTGDPAIILLNSAGPAIDTSRYRYLTYRLKVDGPYDIANGSVTRVFWSPAANPGGAQVTTSKDILAYAGIGPGVNDFVTYTIDLAPLFVGPNGGIEPIGAQQTWPAANPARYFRIDPFEFNAQRGFHVDFVRLAAMAETSAGSTFTLKYAAADADAGATSTVSLYYAADKAGPKTLIASGLPMSGAGTYAWTTSGVPAGTYWIYAEATDPSPFNGPDVRGLWSTGQIRITPSVGGTLTVTMAGTGTGTVSGNGITCPGDCTQTYGAPTPVTLTAGATGGSVFTGWLGGGCTGNAPTCTVNVASAANVSATFAPPGTVVSLDVDLSAPQTRFDALTDGLLVVRYLFGLTSNPLVASAVGTGAQRPSAAAIKAYLDNIRPALDVDGNSSVDAPTDGLMILRRLFGLSGASVTNGATGAGATRDAASIQGYIDSLMQ